MSVIVCVIITITSSCHDSSFTEVSLGISYDQSNNLMSSPSSAFQSRHHESWFNLLILSLFEGMRMRQSECRSDVNFWCFEPTDMLPWSTAWLWRSVQVCAVQCDRGGAMYSAVLYTIQCSVGGTMKDQLESTSGLVRGTHVPPKTPEAPPVTMHSNRHGATTILGITSYFCAAAHI